MDVGSKIRNARKEKGLSQIEVAQAAGIAVNSLRLYEANKRQPRMKQLQAIADTLGVSISYLLGEPIKIEVSMPDFPWRLPSKEEITHMAPAEQEYYYLRLLADTAPEALKRKLIESYSKLNKLGQMEAVRRIGELAERQQYTGPDQTGPKERQ